MTRQYFKINNDIVLNDIMFMHPALYLIFSWVLAYCTAHNLPFNVSSFISDRGQLKNVTRVHSDGRAFDLSLKGISELHRARIVFRVNKIFKSIAAISNKTGQPLAAYDKPHGTGPHIHFQVHPDANVIDFISDCQTELEVMQ